MKKDPSSSSMNDRSRSHRGSDHVVENDIVVERPHSPSEVGMRERLV